VSLSRLQDDGRATAGVALLTRSLGFLAAAETARGARAGNVHLSGKILGMIDVERLRKEKRKELERGDSHFAGPEKRPHIPHKVVDAGGSLFRLEFTTVEVGSYVVDVTVAGLAVPDSPLIAKAYDAGLIKVTDIQDGIVGELSTFRGRYHMTRGELAFFAHLLARRKREAQVLPPAKRTFRLASRADSFLSFPTWRPGK